MAALAQSTTSMSNDTKSFMNKTEEQLNVTAKAISSLEAQLEQVTLTLDKVVKGAPIQDKAEAITTLRSGKVIDNKVGTTQVHHNPAIPSI